MKVWRGFTLTLWVALMSITAAFAIHYYAIQSTVLDSAKAKTWLSQGDTYDKLRDEFLAPQITGAINQKVPENKLLDTPLVKSVLSDILPRDQLVKRIEPAVANTYRWLDSKEPEVTFSISLTDKKDAFYKTLETKLATKINGLNECEDYYYPPEEALLENLCLPAYITASEATQGLMGYIRASDLSVGDTITSESFTVPAQQAKALKQLPTYLNMLWAINLVALAVFTVIAIFVLFSRRSVGVIAVGVSLILAGGIVLITAPLLSASFLPPGSDGLAVVLSSVIKTFIPKLVAVSTQLGLIALVVGLVLTAGGVIWQRKRGLSVSTH